MLIKIEEDLVINTNQIVSITRSAMKDMPSLISMSDETMHLHKLEPLELADKLVKAEAAADTYYFL